MIRENELRPPDVLKRRLKRSGFGSPRKSREVT